MKKNSSLLSKERSKKLLNYGALVGALAGVSEASGQIVYTDINPDFAGTGNTEYMLDLNDDGIDDFKIYQIQSSYTSWFYGYTYYSNYLYMAPLVATNEMQMSSIGGSTSQYAYPFALDPGDMISSGQSIWNNNGYSFGYTSLNYNSSDGNFIGVTDKYIGVRFDISGATHYGWIRLDVNTDGDSWTVKDYAYNATAGDPIQAGQTTLATADVDLAQTVKIVGMNKSIGLYNLPDNVSYKVYGITGQTIAEGSIENTDTKVVELGNSITNGVYIVELQDKDTNGIYRKKVML